MARIADKKTGKLTKHYRNPSVFHASTRRHSYRRKKTYTRRKRTSFASSTTVNKSSPIATCLIAGGLLCVLIWFLPILAPIGVGCILLWGVDKVCKTKWNLPAGKWSMPASWGWTILTAFEIIVSFIIVLLIVIEETTIIALIIDLIVYVCLSFLILFHKYKKIMNANMLKTDERRTENDMIEGP